MARQALGAKKVRKYRRDTGLDAVAGLVRGGTDHRVDLLLRGGRVYSYWPKHSVGEFCGDDFRHETPPLPEFAEQIGDDT